MNSLQSWPEPIIRVQSLSDSGLTFIPDQYVKPLADRPSITEPPPPAEINIPVIDLSQLFSPDRSIRSATARLISRACREWGSFK
ncbi:putative 2-oxoglutarate-dependent dioxygenase JRG21 [Camellia lanceoleosa]|uniref:2-oxoglutarate-dependent dioxygenase JRG21 n=1 Tax=Camellia lanceoleosa TaxID=1840588 RepID=A0ACC0GAW1_9ERIC|nr:putative 2-oxoglutarate-dependent dioxygenase JRG21 [Camellia lanceoleosa]